jgi:hypothetical protein
MASGQQQQHELTGRHRTTTAKLVTGLAQIAGDYQAQPAWPQPEMPPRNVDALAWYIEQTKRRPPQLLYVETPNGWRLRPPALAPAVMRRLVRPRRRPQRVAGRQGRRVVRRSSGGDPPHPDDDLDLGWSRAVALDDARDDRLRSKAAA